MAGGEKNRFKTARFGRLMKIRRRAPDEASSGA
jgi:hypothetical protein